MKYKIANAMKTGEFDSKFGKMFKYTVQLEGENDAVEIVQKPETPAPSGEVEGTIEDTQYGKKFKKVQAGGGYGGKSDPATQKAIIRQNSLTNAVAYCTAKAGLMGPEKALKFLTGKEIIQVATYFAKYSEGLVTVVTESEKEEVPEKQVDEIEEKYTNEGQPPRGDDPDEVNIEELDF